MDPKEAITLNIVVEALAGESSLSLNEVEVLHGKLVHFAQHVPPISLLMVEILEFLQNLLGVNQLLLKGNKARSTRKYPVPATLKQDLKGVYAVVRNTMELPLLISSWVKTHPMFAIEVFTDIPMLESTSSSKLQEGL